LNHTDPLGPRYTGTPSSPASTAQSGAPDALDALRLVTFNVQYANHVDRAIEVLNVGGPLKGADIIALQEMDAAGTKRIADALGMAYVYYPAILHRRTHRDFGNAILSRWPIVDDRKIILPHLARFENTQRIATAATVIVGDEAIRVYSVHLATWIEIGPDARRDQVYAVLADAKHYDRVIVSGDMNSYGIGAAFQMAGYHWSTEHNPASDRWFNWDHIFLKGFDAPQRDSAGVVHDNRGASDHRPVWAVVVPAP
jgi:endonuclease/exonuclease/phosphatase family metal-dependent hydrolase